ncbi:asparaginase domain-containing protein [Corynebacterium sphenisci]|uniref:asparaginase domain-containing protein n=1 Tax=Corynebacterium sphenisci TaxID=191493 RepID=UPI0026E0A143|nr:asparaginase domain-containing protein [Corynebacterium sphenisci]MDO5730681.1 asparaginase domain-containing protein [Corynebacterium sphenisci]
MDQPAPAETPAAPARLVVLATGGTIACTRDRSGALVPTRSGAELVAGVAARFPDGALEVEVRDLARRDSAALTMADVDAVVEACHAALADPGVTGVVVLHGTDTMEETAAAVDLFHDDPRPVVFTGAQRPADDPEADGPGNLFEAMVVAADASARGIGALIVFGHAVLPARGAVKWHAQDPLAFATNAPEDPPRPAPLPRVALAGTRVDVIAAYPGADGALVDAALAAGAEGLVLVGYGAGNIGGAFAAAAGRALDAGVPVVMCTRVPRGVVRGDYGGAGGGATLAARGVIGAGCLHAGQARVALAAALAAGVHPQTLFDAPD